jgi:capsular polysaccharide transport system permease protein
MANDLLKPSALERARQVQGALVEAVRRSRLSARRRRNYDTGTFSRRRGARLWSAFFALTFIFIFVLPSVGSIVYFSFIASPQYVVETRFTVQGGSAAQLDGLGMVTGLPSANVVQDTQVVANYIQSQAIVEILEAELDLRHLYGSSDIDWPARFNVKKPVEKLVDYWKSKIDVSIQLPGGIITLTIRAFTAGDALRVGEAVIELSEALVNNMNQRMLTENAASSQQEFDRSVLRLGQARQTLEKARNTEGMLDAGRAGNALGDLVTGLRGDQLKLQQDYNSQSKYVSVDAPQMRALAIRLKAISEQIHTIEAQMTGHPASGADKLISGSMTRFSELELESRIAERQYASAAGSLNAARATAERKLVYLQTFVRPALPQEPLYPKRLLSVVIVCFGSFLAWATLSGFATLARNNMA